MSKKAALAFIFPLAFAVTACGNSGGGVSSAPPPPPPPPPPPAASYTKIQDLTGSQTLQSATQKYQTGAAGFEQFTQQDFGTGTVFQYNFDTDDFTITAPSGVSATFTQADIVAAQSTPLSQVFANNAASALITDRVEITTPTVGGIAMSYTRIGLWSQISTGNPTIIRLILAGVPTIQSDVPTTGSSTYNTETGGFLTRPNAGGGVSLVSLNNSTATFSTNFGTGDITTGLTLVSDIGENFGTIAGTGQINSGGPGFSGNLTGNLTNGPNANVSTTGNFSGVFFGPQALEMGYNWNLSGTGFTAGGVAIGVKQ